MSYSEASGGNWRLRGFGVTVEARLRKRLNQGSFYQRQCVRFDGPKGPHWLGKKATKRSEPEPRRDSFKTALKPRVHGQYGSLLSRSILLWPAGVWYILLPWLWNALTRPLFGAKIALQWIVLHSTWLYYFYLIMAYVCLLMFFPNSFSYGVFANIGSGAVPGRLPGGFREGSGAGSESRVPGRFRGRFWTTGSGAGSEPRSEPKVPGQPGQFFEPRSEPRVPGRFRGRFRTTGSGKVPGQVLNDRFREGSGSVFRTTFRTTGSRKVPGQVPNHEFRQGSGAGSERQVPGRFEPRSEPRVPGRFRGRFRFTSSGKSTVYVWIFNIYSHNGNGHEWVADCLDCAIESSARSLCA